MLTVVTGPPCSGKTTYVHSHAQPGDIIIDFDTLARALGSADPHRHNAQVRHITTAARRAAIDAALATHHHTTVWIVDCRISTQRAGAYRKAGATIITLGADQRELHRRAATERPPLWHRLIDEWQPNPSIDSNTGSRPW